MTLLRCYALTLFLSAVSAVSASTAWAYTPGPFTSGQGQSMWDLDTLGYPSDNVIPYKINVTRPAGSEILPAGTSDQQVIAAIRSAFQSYENIATSKLRFDFRGVDAGAIFAEDGIILVTLDFNDPGVSCVSSNFKKRLIAPVVGRYTFADTNEDVWIEKQYSTIDYDIALCNVGYAVNSSDGNDLESLLAHELGHVFGLSHSIAQPTSMTGYSLDARETGRTLSTDDQIGISVLYPEPGFFAQTGTIDGVVEEVDALGTPIGEVFGAHITVVDSSTGRVVADGISGVSAVDPISRRAIAWDATGVSGRFVVSGLPPGSYRLRIDAYDGPALVGSTSKIINLAFFDYDALGPRRDFAYRMDPAIHAVSAGAVTDVGTLSVAPFVATFPNMDAGIITDTGGVWRHPGVVLTGQTTRVGLPIGENLSPSDQYFVDGTSAVVLSNPRVSGTGFYMLVDAVVDADAPLGAHNIVVQNADGFSLIHGGLLIASGVPLLTHVEPACAAAGELVEVRGEHFTPDTHITFDGLLASDIVVHDPTRITLRPTDPLVLPYTAGLVSDVLLGEVASGDLEFTGACPSSPVPGLSGVMIYWLALLVGVSGALVAWRRQVPG